MFGRQTGPRPYPGDCGYFFWVSGILEGRPLAFQTVPNHEPRTSDPFSERRTGAQPERQDKSGETAGGLTCTAPAKVAIRDTQPILWIAL